MKKILMLLIETLTIKKKTRGYNIPLIIIFVSAKVIFGGPVDAKGEKFTNCQSFPFNERRPSKKFSKTSTV